MKKITVFLTLLALLMAAIPLAAQAVERVGEPINLLIGEPTGLAAGEAFHIAHGWSTEDTEPACPPPPAPIGSFDFHLEVDGVLREADGIEQTVGGSDGCLEFTLVWVHNFPDGLAAGTHTFTGRWFAPCQFAVDRGLYPGPCPSPVTKVEVETIDLTVNFVEP
jgi:hypothetical protein